MATTKRICPNCESVDFKCQQHTWNEQSFTVSENDEIAWGTSDNFDYESEHPVAVVCAECSTDCTDLFTDDIQFYEDKFEPRVVPEKVTKGEPNARTDQ